MINVNKLHKELEQAGIIIRGCNEYGIVWAIEGNEIQNRPDVLAVLNAHDPIEAPPEFQEFFLPIVAPDFIVASPKPKSDPKQALAEAISEAKKPHGTKKSIALIVLDLVNYIEDLEKRFDILEKEK